MPIQAVIFDRDNTLLHFDTAAIAALEARIALVAPEIPPGAAVACWLSWNGGWPRTPADEPAFWAKFWSEFAALHRLPSAAAEDIRKIGAFYHTCFRAFPDALDCLRALRSRDLRLAVLTNFELPSIDLTLQHAGVDPSWFHALLSSAAIGCHKPDPQAYLAAAAALKLAPEQCAFVDDLPENVQAARALGMHAWLLDRRDTVPSSSLPRIRDLHALAALLA
jgi:putative hydrolase of the HAD superfamily